MEQGNNTKRGLTRIALTTSEVLQAIANGHSLEARIVGFCDDCENEDDNLKPYKYETSIVLCEVCTGERMMAE